MLHLETLHKILWAGTKQSCHDTLIAKLCLIHFEYQQIEQAAFQEARAPRQILY